MATADSAYHPNVFISSTVVDLPEHRKAAIDAIWRSNLYPLAMERDRAESADAVTYSLRLAEDAHVYLGIFGFRYGVPRGEDRISITEMEFRRAEARHIPVLIFLMDETKHLVLPTDVETDPERLAKLTALKSELRAKYVCGFFRSADDLAGQIVQALATLRDDKQLVRVASDSTPTTMRIHAPQVSLIPSLPEPYFAHPYILTHQLCGRVNELAALDTWATADPSAPVLVVESIGGEGKSALSWHWLQQRTRTDLSHLAGVMWWSFYETDATVPNFVRHALAYFTETPLKEFEDLDRATCEQALLRTLAEQPALLVLDGLERILVAYARSDAPYLSDDRVGQETRTRNGSNVSNARGGTEWLRHCSDPADGAFIARLTRVALSKVLISTRLMPSELRERGNGETLPGVRIIRLVGLESGDAFEFIRHLGVRGERSQVLAFLEQFGYHSLLIEVLAGRIARYYPAPGDFAAWYSDEGIRLHLGELELSQRRTHILRYALAGIVPELHTLLCKIAAFRYPVEYAALVPLNPYLRPSPDPDLPPLPDASEEDKARIERWLRQLSSMTTLQSTSSGFLRRVAVEPQEVRPSQRVYYEAERVRQQRAKLQAQLSRIRDVYDETGRPQRKKGAQKWRRRPYLEAELARVEAELVELRARRSRLINYEAAVEAARADAARAHKEATREAQTPFHQALTELEDRGLLHWDRTANRYDLHPIVRASAFEQLEGNERTEAFLHIRDHFQALPPEDMTAVTDLADVRRTLEIYHALIGAELRDDAFTLYKERLSDVLSFTLEANETILELLAPLFPEQLNLLEAAGVPSELSSSDDQSSCMNAIAAALSGTGALQQALAMHSYALRFNLDRNDIADVELHLQNYALELSRTGHVAKAVHVLNLDREITKAVGNPEMIAMGHLRVLEFSVRLGRWDDAAFAYKAFSSRPPTFHSLIWKSHAECSFARMLFLQGHDAIQAVDRAKQLAELAHGKQALRNALDLEAEIALSNGQFEHAARLLEARIEQEKRSGYDVSHLLVNVARVYAAAGRANEARTLLSAVVNEAVDYVSRLRLAEAYLTLGEHEQASDYALAAYRGAWGEGSPYSWWEGLDRSQRVLAALGLPAPELPPFDTDTLQPLEYEDEIRSLISRTISKVAKTTARRKHTRRR